MTFHPKCTTPLHQSLCQHYISHYSSVLLDLLCSATYLHEILLTVAFVFCAAAQCQCSISFTLAHLVLNQLVSCFLGYCQSNDHKDDFTLNQRKENASDSSGRTQSRSGRNNRSRNVRKRELVQPVLLHLMLRLNFAHFCPVSVHDIFGYFGW